jgi:hypothetical protein
MKISRRLSHFHKAQVLATQSILRFSVDISKKFMATAIVFSLVGIPTQAKAGPVNELWDLINKQHMASGCPAYERSVDLDAASLDVAKSLTIPPRPPAPPRPGYSPGFLAPPDPMSVLFRRSKSANPFGDARYVVGNNVGSPRAAFDFWMANPTRAIFSNCDMRQGSIAVWINNGRWAAVFLAGRVQPLTDLNIH